MVSTSNWPPLVAMSVVTLWRSTFSSSVTHLTVMSGFLAVNSPVSPCMRIISPLLTVAIVSAVSAFEGTEAKSATAPKRTLRTFLKVTSHFAVLSIYPHVGRMFTPVTKVVKAERAISVVRAARGNRLNLVGWKTVRTMRSVENGARGGFVGDEPVDQASGQRRLDGGDLRLPECRGNRRCLRRHLRWNAGQPAV